MASTYTLTVYNTITSQHEEVSVTKEVYDEYRRGNWRLEKAEDKHDAYETPFSSLIGGRDGTFENFHEFIDTANIPDNLIIKKEQRELAYDALSTLTETMLRRYLMRYEGNLSLKEIAIIEGVSIDSAKENIEKAQARIKNFLSKF